MCCYFLPPKHQIALFYCRNNSQLCNCILGHNNSQLCNCIFGFLVMFFRLLRRKVKLFLVSLFSE